MLLGIIAIIWNTHQYPIAKQGLKIWTAVGYSYEKDADKA